MSLPDRRLRGKLKLLILIIKNIFTSLTKSEIIVIYMSNALSSTSSSSGRNTVLSEVIVFNNIINYFIKSYL